MGPSLGQACACTGWRTELSRGGEEGYRLGLNMAPDLSVPGAQNGVYYVEVDVEGGGGAPMARGRLGADSAEARSRRAKNLGTPRKPGSQAGVAKTIALHTQSKKVYQHLGKIPPQKIMILHRSSYDFPESPFASFSRFPSPDHCSMEPTKGNHWH